MKAEGWKFPPVREAEAMFEADTAPDWEEGILLLHNLFNIKISLYIDPGNMNDIFTIKFQSFRI